MKRINIFIALFFAAASLVFAPGCMMRGCMGMRMIHGSGSMRTIKKDLPGFSKVRLSGMGRIIIIQGNKTAIEITSDDNIVSRISATVSADTLKIRNRGPETLRPTKGIEYRIFLKNLDSVKISGSGKITCKKLETRSLTIGVSGSAGMDMNLTADKLELNISGSADAKFTGKVREQSVDISGSGNYEAAKLHSREARIRISGSGNARVHALEKLDVNISGAGAVSYSGNPKITQTISGVGKIRGVDE
jgi:hypothetical protein